VPDLAERMAEIQADPVRRGYFLAIRQEIGEGHDQLVDGAFTSVEGRYLYVSRPSLADVVAISLKTRRIVWRTRVEGSRSDHIALSPDGRRLLVSASTARKVHVIDTRTGAITGSFESGDQPHESNVSKDGELIFHASIGTVFTPLDDPIFDATKGDGWFEVVDARTLHVLAQLPLSHVAAAKRRDEYLLDSPHHGIAINPQDTKLCVAGTMSTTRRSSIARRPPHPSSRSASSPTGRRTAPTAATASCPSPATIACP
jgi:DNA-binding beta-propeller fold protein YncE